MKSKNNVIALWGASASGKTATTVKLALSLVEQNKKVIVLLPEDMAPMLPCICAESNYSNMGTLGSVFIAPHITSALISYQLSTIESIPTLAFLGFQKGENRYTYPAPTLTQCEELIAKCSQMADYLLLDTSSNFTRDLLSTTALLASDCVVRLETLDIKNISYLSSNLALLTDHAKFSAEKQIRVLNDIHDMSWDVSKQKKNYDLLTPHCQELGSQSRSGNLLNALKEKDSLPYKKGIKKLTELITRKVDVNEATNNFFL